MVELKGFRVGLSVSMAAIGFSSSSSSRGSASESILRTSESRALAYSGRQLFVLRRDCLSRLTVTLSAASCSAACGLLEFDDGERQSELTIVEP